MSHTRSGRTAITAAFLVSACAASALAAPPPGYTAQVLRFDTDPAAGAPPFTEAVALNNLGQIVGTFGQGDRQGYVWSGADGLQTFETLFGVAGADWNPRDISDAGQIVGGYNDTGVFGFSRAFSGALNGDFSPLPGLIGDPAASSVAGAVNESGLIVGAASTEPPGMFGAPAAAVGWDNGAIFEIGTLGGPNGAATGVNASGEVVGAASPGFGLAEQAFRWTESGGFVTLDTWLENGPALATDITDSGYVAGSSSAPFPDARRVAAMWTPDNELVVMPWAFGEESVAEVFAINESLQMVGQEYNFNADELTATLYQDGEAYFLRDFVDLPEGVLLSSAMDINDLGQIVVNGFDTVNEEFVVVLLTPIPAPSSAVALLAGAAVVRRRRR